MNVPRIDFREYHRRLPALLSDGRGALAARGARGLNSLAFRLSDSGEAVTYTPTDAGIEIADGEDSAVTVVELAHAYWEGLVHDLESAPGLLYGGFATGHRGDMMDFVCWEPALRAMYRGRPIYDPDTLDLRDLDGSRLDPTHSFCLEDEDVNMAHFLATTGYVLVRNVFTASEVGSMLEEGERLRADAIEGNQQSWWGAGAGGERVLVRVLNAGTRKRLADLYDDPRIVRLSKLPREKLLSRERFNVNGVTILWKQPGVVEGLGDLPWHRDCGMGGHAVMCPAINCSIHLGPANPESGDLRFMPGSWQASVGFADRDEVARLRGVSIDARAGDVSLHYGDVAHEAPPPTSPTGPYRTSLLIGWGQPEAEHHRGQDHYNDALFQGDGNAVPNMREMARRS